mgnify:CR=1 FL=1
MAKEDGPPIEEEDAGAPEWMVTFSDCMTLLLTFFVLLLSFSNFEEIRSSDLKNKIGFGMPSISTDQGGDKSAVSASETIVPVEYVEEGSKTPTLDDKSAGNMSPKRRLADFRQQKVFMVDSEKVFIGVTSVFRPDGRDEILTKLSNVLKVMPSRVVVSEFDPHKESTPDSKSISRAWAVMEYFVENQIDADRISISGTTMLNRNSKVSKRQLVITLLEKKIYD